MALSIILKISISNEEKIYRTYRGKLDSEAKKKEMLDKVKQNKEVIAETIQSIKLPTSLLKNLATELKKLFLKFKKNLKIIKENEDKIAFLQQAKQRRST